MKKKGAIEMSIGTIVIVVLSMSMLILGMVLIKNIFGGATDITDMTNEQIKDEIAGMFGQAKKLILYPDSKNIEVRNGDTGAFAVGIQNRLTGGASQSTDFRYIVSVAEIGNCPVGERELLELIVTGREINPTNIVPGGEPIVRKVKLSVAEGFPLCSFSYQIDSFHSDNVPYATEFMDVTIIA